MAAKTALLLRLPPDLRDDLHRWARDDLRSVNSQIEFLLRDAVRKWKRDRPGEEELPEEFDPQS